MPKLFGLSFSGIVSFYQAYHKMKYCKNTKKPYRFSLQKLSTRNFLFVDTSYNVVPHDHIAYRYECLESLGKGSFGNVVLVVDHKTREKCALKVVRSDIRFTSQVRICS